MAVIKVSAAAEDDLKEIWTHVAGDDAATATNLVKEVTRKFATLRDHPQMGREQNELLVKSEKFSCQKLHHLLSAV